MDDMTLGMPEPAGAASFFITPPNMQVIVVRLTGTAPLVTCRFSEKAFGEMKDKQEKGSIATKGKKREAKDFDQAFRGACHVSREGWYGVHAGAFRNAMIAACRLVNFKMTLAKLSLFVTADGVDRVDGVPLVRILGGEPERIDLPVRNATGVIDIRSRPIWHEWAIDLRVRFDADQFTAEDVVNLLMRVGEQVGIGEGRANSRQSAGVGWGHFSVASAA